MVVAETIVTVKPSRVLIGAQERLGRTLIDGNCFSTEFNGIKRIAGRLFHGNISGHRGDRENSDIGGAKCHDDGHGIVGSGIGIN